MKIGIDISQTAYKGTGVARYTTSLLKGLLRYDTKNEYILFFSSLRRPVPDEILKIIENKAEIKRFRIPPSILSILWNKIHKVPIERFIGKVDLFLSSDWTEPPAKHAKKITVIHDLVPYKYPETSDKKIIETHKQRLKWVKKESDLISCNSNATAADAIEILGLKKENIRVVYPGVEIFIRFTCKEKITTDKKELTDIDKGIVKWLVEIMDTSEEPLVGIATILTMVQKRDN